MKTFQILCDGELVATCPSEATALRVAVGLTEYDDLDIIEKIGEFGVQHYVISDDQTRLIPWTVPE